MGGNNYTKFDKINSRLNRLDRCCCEAQDNITALQEAVAALGLDLGEIYFVSTVTGDNATAVPGDPTKPYSTLYGATSSVVGTDNLIYVLPGDHTFVGAINQYSIVPNQYYYFAEGSEVTFTTVGPMSTTDLQAGDYISVRSLGKVTFETAWFRDTGSRPIIDYFFLDIKHLVQANVNPAIIVDFESIAYINEINIGLVESTNQTVFEKGSFNTATISGVISNVNIGTVHFTRDDSGPTPASFMNLGSVFSNSARLQNSTININIGSVYYNRTRTTNNNSSQNRDHFLGLPNTTYVESTVNYNVNIGSFKGLVATALVSHGASNGAGVISTKGNSAGNASVAVKIGSCTINDMYLIPTNAAMPKHSRKDGYTIHVDNFQGTASPIISATNGSGTQYYPTLSGNYTVTGLDWHVIYVGLFATARMHIQDAYIKTDGAYAVILNDSALPLVNSSLKNCVFINDGTVSIVDGGTGTVTMSIMSCYTNSTVVPVNLTENVDGFVRDANVM